MSTQTVHNSPTLVKHAGPPLWLLASLYTVLFNAGLAPVTMFGGLPYWPGPWEAPGLIVSFFQTQSARVLACVFLQTGAIVCLGLFTAVVVSRLQFLRVQAAGVYIALLGGFLTVFDSMAAGFATWTLIRPAIAQTPSSVLALNGGRIGIGWNQDADTALADDLRAGVGGVRRAERVPHDLPAASVSDPACTVSRVHLDRRGGIRLAESQAGDNRRR